MNDEQLTTAGQLKAALKRARAVYVWCCVWGDEGEYVQTTKKALSLAMMLDTGDDARAVKARLDGGILYVN